MAFADAAVQVDLMAAAKHGTVVFNAPFANTRSVAELMIAEVSCSYPTYLTCIVALYSTHGCCCGCCCV